MQLVVVVNYFPTLSEGFIENEILSLRKQGVELTVVNCSTADPLAAEAGRTRSSERIRILFELFTLLIGSPVSTVRLVATSLRCASASFRSFWIALRAVVVARRIDRQLGPLRSPHFHAHFLHQPALVALLVARHRHATYSLSAHARDIFVPELRLNRLCRDAQFITVCSVLGKNELLKQIGGDSQDRVKTIHHGVDLDVYQSEGKKPRVNESSVVNFLTVSRLVSKKGIDTILESLRLLKSRGWKFNYRIAGAGPENHRLVSLANRLGLEEVEFLGPQDREAIRELYRAADVFLLGCRQTADGDRDGIPNVILEAMAMSCPVVVCDAGAVDEVVHDMESGILIPPDNPLTMANSLEQLLRNPSLQENMATQARRVVERRFDLHRNVRVLAGLLD